MTERLEEMNKKVVGLIDGEDFSDLVQMDVDTYAWFYEQAERAEKNAQDLEDMDRQLYREQQQIKRYREALEFYADEENYEFETIVSDCDIEVVSKLLDDYGQKARNALEREG